MSEKSKEHPTLALENRLAVDIATPGHWLKQKSKSSREWDRTLARTRKEQFKSTTKPHTAHTKNSIATACASQLAVVVDHAKLYAAQGWRVLAIRANDKRPIATGWQEAPLEQVLSLFGSNPNANIGIAVPAGYMVLDVDVKTDGPATLKQLVKTHGNLPETLTASTQGGGTHLWFKLPAGATVGNKVAIAAGLDVRANGGYVVAAPSTIDGKGYAWINWDCHSAPSIANAPAWIMALMCNSNARMTQGREQERIPEGQRNSTLFRNASAMWRAGVSQTGVESAIADINANLCAPPLEDGEVTRISESACRYEQGQGFAMPGAAWADPTPLPDALPPVQLFDAALLPEALRGWVMDIAHRMQCPPDFPAVGAVVALSSLIGARAVVAPKTKDDWRLVPNLWGMIVGRPGVMKSPALAEVLRPLHQLEATEREQWHAIHGEWELDCKVAEMATKDNEKKAAAQAGKDPAKARALLQPVQTPPEPTRRRYVVNDATVEKLGELLTVNPWGVLVYRDELHGLLTSMDRQGQEGGRGFYLTGYDGNQGHAVDRIGRGETYVPRVCLAMLGGIQPGKAQSYVRDAVSGGVGDDGLLQRFGLAVWPEVNREFIYVDQWPDTPAKLAAWAVFDRLSRLQPLNDTEPQEWRFSPEAQDLFEEWLSPFETEIRGDELHPALVSHLAKYRKLIPALALIFALVDTPDSGGVIHVGELKRALEWGQYLRSHADRLYAAAVIPETTGAKQLLDKIQAAKLCDSDGVLTDSFTPRQVAVKHWAGLNTPEAVRKAADLLADFGWLRHEASPSGEMGGRPGERYLIHPRLLKGRA